jgi:hypothetical protein
MGQKLIEGSNPSLSASREIGTARRAGPGEDGLKAVLQVEQYAPVAQLDRVHGYEP